MKPPSLRFGAPGRGVKNTEGWPRRSFAKSGRRRARGRFISEAKLVSGKSSQKNKILIATKGMLFRRRYTIMLLILEPIVPEFRPISSKTEARGGRPPGEQVQLPEEAVLLRIFIGEDDHYKRLPLYEAIVLKAREMHLAGGTVLRGILGFGKSSQMHTARG